jgi:superfamily II DNA helicase RecQ
METCSKSKQKMHDIKKFLHHGKIENPKDPSDSFDPRILIATSGSADAGIDSPCVCVVLHDSFPTSIEDLLQELGQAARCPASLRIATDCCCIDMPLKSHVSLVKCIHREPSKDEARGSDACMSAEKCQKHQMQNLDKVLKLLALNTEQCLHCKLEHAASDTFEPARHAQLGECDTAYSSCARKKGLFKSMSGRGVCGGACWGVSEIGWRQFLLG